MSDRIQIFSEIVMAVDGENEFNSTVMLCFSIVECLKNFFTANLFVQQYKTMDRRQITANVKNKPLIDFIEILSESFVESEFAQTFV